MKSTKNILILVMLFIFICNIAIGDENYKTIKLPNNEEVKVSRIIKENSYRYDIIFSDGNSYFREVTKTSFTGGGSCDLSLKQMDKADEIISLYEQIYGIAEVKPDSNKGFSIFLIIIGFLNVAFPKIPWYLKYGFAFKDSEPSERGLLIFRIVGVLVIIMGIIGVLK